VAAARGALAAPFLIAAGPGRKGRLAKRGSAENPARGAAMSRNDHSDDRSKRTLEPIHTRGYKHIPHLRDKLPWLFGLHPFIKRNYELARELHVSPATLSTWLNGVRFSDARTIAPANPDSIPIEHFRSFVDLWGLPADVLDLEDLDEFRRTIEHFELGRGAWERLVRAVPDDTRIEIIVEDATRGLVDPDEEEELGIPHFNVGARIMLRIASAGLRHGALLEQDRSGWLSLRPNPRWTETNVDGQMIFPRQHADGPPRFARLEGPGLHRLLAVFTDEPLPVGVLEILMGRPIDPGRLNYTATVIQSRLAAGPDKCQLVSRRFLAVTPAD
jgi:hypothetical protein